MRNFSFKKIGLVALFLFVISCAPNPDSVYQPQVNSGGYQNPYQGQPYYYQPAPTYYVPNYYQRPNSRSYQNPYYTPPANSPYYDSDYYYVPPTNYGGSGNEEYNFGGKAGVSPADDKS